jgi:hypothetical protein
MPDESSDRLSREVRVNEIIAAYLKGVDAGQASGRAELLARHPELAEELRAFFADHDAVTPQAEAPPPGPEASTLGPARWRHRRAAAIQEGGRRRPCLWQHRWGPQVAPLEGRFSAAVEALEATHA